MSGVNLDEDTVLQRRDLAWRVVAGETVIVDPEGSVIMGLNGTGGRVWEQLDGERTLGTIAADIADEHGVETQQALGDVLRFARTLVDRSLARPT